MWIGATTKFQKSPLQLSRPATATMFCSGKIPSKMRLDVISDGS